MSNCALVSTTSLQRKNTLTTVNTYSYQVFQPEPDDIEMESLKKQMVHRGQPRANLLRETQAFRSTYGYVGHTERDQRPSSTLAQHQSAEGKNRET